MNRPPHQTSKEAKIRDALIVRAAMEKSPLLQKEIAAKLGYRPDAIGQWFHKEKPTNIPDWAFCQLGAMLGFDPADTRPWLRDQYLALHKIYGEESAEKLTTTDILRFVLKSLPPEDVAEILKDALPKD